MPNRTFKNDAADSPGGFSGRSLCRFLTLGKEQYKSTFHWRVGKETADAAPFMGTASVLLSPMANELKTI